MCPMKLLQLLTILPFYKTSSNIDELTIKGLEVDSRKVNQGDLFICIKGFTVDGHDYAVQAEKNGAIAIIAERELDVQIPTIIVDDSSRALSKIAVKFYKFPTESLQLIGITGTNGKTTITYILEAIFQTFKQKTGIIGTIQMKIGEKSMPIANTTPDAFQLQRSFKQMVDQSVDVAIMEVSSHALDLGRVAGCNFDVAIYTNLSQDHLDYHETMEEYLQAKMLLFSQLGNSYAQAQPKYAILNYDDPYFDKVKKSTTQTVVSYGLTDEAMIYASNIQLQPNYTYFDLHTPGGTVSIKSQLIGKFNIYNMLAAVSAAYVYDVPLAVIQQALENLSGVSGRLEQINEGQNYTVIVDYAHTPDSLENVLQTINQFTQGKVHVVVGTGGDRDRTKRPL